MTVLHGLGITLLLILALWVVQTAADAGEIFAAGLWLHIDGLGGLFLAILGVIGFLTGVYSIGYMRHEVAHGELSPVTLCDYYGFFHLFLFTMLLVVTSNNLIVMWAAIEATTLSSAFLVGIYGQRSSLEAAWKYIIICTVGVAFGLFGTVLVYANAASVMPQAEMAIFWSEVLKQSSLLDPTLMLLAFVFVLIGFGTKTGLFPMHAWLPDAHSEAPESGQRPALRRIAELRAVGAYSLLHHYLPGHRQRFPQPVVAHLRHVVGCRGGIFHSGTAGH